MKMTGNIRGLVGVFGTILWTLFVGLMVYVNWCDIPKLTLNEWGDFFAGVFAPLAFLWLVLGYFQQGVELRQNTSALEQQERALSLQVEELRASVDQQKSLVDLTRQEVESSRANMEQTHRVNKLLAQPVVHKIAARPNLNQQQQKVYVDIDIENAGHSVTEVIAALADPSDNYKVLRRGPKNWIKGNNFSFRIVHSAGLPEGAGPDLVFSYIDGTGDQSNMKFKLAINRNGTLGITEKGAGAE